MSNGDPKEYQKRSQAIHVQASEQKRPILAAIQVAVKPADDQMKDEMTAENDRHFAACQAIREKRDNVVMRERKPFVDQLHEIDSEFDVKIRELRAEFGLPNPP